MPDIIQLLPDNIANQIAAGEVIQRPASAVKELLENSVDAGADEIKLIVQDAGKSLIQVIDNGKGMSEMDARMAFERHATSKIRQIEDLFRIRTMGFRGEALASIAAVSQVLIKTRRPEDETATLIELENSQVIRQEPVAAPVGTNIILRNLFFNVPARRNFLKSNASEMRHIIEEFIRVALSFPNIFFSLSHNGQEVFHLEKGSLKQRIVQILGMNQNAKLVSVQENTDYLNIYGFVGKPDAARKTRGEQYFFVNNRFIRSAYLNHAVMSAFQDMIAPDSFPLYALFIDLDPSQVDINVHPTKQEIKFEDEKIIYAFVLAAVKHSLAQFSITPTLDFDLDPHIQRLDAVSKPLTAETQAQALNSSLYKTFSQRHQAHIIEPAGENRLERWNAGWKKEREDWNPNEESTKEQGIASRLPFAISEDKPVTQFLNTYILLPTHQGLILVHQQRAHERILYERFTASNHGKPMVTQRSIFPASIELSTSDAALLMDLLPDLNELGYLIEPFGKNSFVIQGTPADTNPGNEKAAIENLLEQFKHFSSDKVFSRREKIIRSLAWQHAIKAGAPLDDREMKTLVESLFACTQPNVNANGVPTYLEIKTEYLEKIFAG